MKDTSYVRMVWDLTPRGWTGCTMKGIAEYTERALCNSKRIPIKELRVSRANLMAEVSIPADVTLEHTEVLRKAILAEVESGPAPERDIPEGLFY